jgi:GMP synthase-like glutamine amidotransferase
MRALIIQNCPPENIGMYADYLCEHGIASDTIHAYEPGAEFPVVGDYDAIFVGGTPLSVCDIDQYDFLLRERDYLKKALDQKKHCFGICAGGQLLAHVLGAGVRKNAQPEIGCYELRLTAAGITDPLLGGFPSSFQVFQWHSDTFDLPKGASLLAESDFCKNQLFRMGTAIAVQFHLEETAAEVGKWAHKYADELAAIGKEASTILADMCAHEAEMRRLAWLLMDNFFALME